MLDLERFDIAPLRVLMRAGLDAASLVPVFGSRMTRRRGTLVHGSSVVEIALDEGQLRARVDGRRRRRRVTELEVELKSGHPEHLLDIATALVRQRRGVTLVPAVRSKAERGYALAADGVLDVVRASARGFAEHIGPETAAPDVLRAVMRHGLFVVVANADALREAPTSEHVHQARVALRRIRSAIRLLDPEGTDLPTELLDQLRWMARVLGHARDWDVIDEDTLNGILANAGLAAVAQRRLKRRVRRRRDRALARAVAAISSRRYARLVLAAARWTMSAPSAAATATIPVAELLDEAAERLYKDARSFSKLDRHQRHRVRIHAKRLRYALDLLASRLPDKGASDYVDALASLQESLGELNDASTAVERLTPLARAPNDERALAAWLSRAEQDLVPRAARQLRLLARRHRPWGARPTR